MTSWDSNIKHVRAYTKHSADDIGLYIDYRLLFVVSLIVVIGIIALTSASISFAEKAMGDPFYYLKRQTFSIIAALIVAVFSWQITLKSWKSIRIPLFALSIVLLVLVLIPGFGKTVNGSARWLSLGYISIQVSEFVKFIMIIYLAGYLARHKENLNELKNVLKPLVIISCAALLLLIEPDFGAAAVITGTAFLMLFIARVKMTYFMTLFFSGGVILALLAFSSPYRLTRLTSFLNPWQDPFASGFQLTQSLIAFGNGGLLGVGLGGSIQKLFYLPEAHTDFLYAVLAEEFGLIGSLTIIILFSYLVWRIYRTGRIADQVGQVFNAYVAYGIATSIGLQAFINMGVNMGLLPTKGLTLPLMSYGGSSLVVTAILIAVVERIYYEASIQIHSSVRYGAASYSPNIPALTS